MKTQLSPVAATSSTRFLSLLVAGTLALSALLASCMFFPIPKDLDLSLNRPTDKGLYQTTIASRTPAVKVNQMHAWTITVRTTDGKPVQHATIAVDGGMPQHGHGLPTQPRVTREIEPGTYLVEGMKFSMTGWWELEFGVTSPLGSDQITYNLVLDEEGV